MQRKKWTVLSVIHAAARLAAANNNPQLQAKTAVITAPPLAGIAESRH